MIRSQVKELYKYRRLVGYLMWARIKSGERDKTFGKVWSLLDPLFLLVIYYFIFNVVFTSRVENFALFLFSAIIAWRFFSQSITISALSIVSNRGLVAEAYFPKSALPITVVALTAYDYLFGVIVLLLLTLLLGVPINAKVLLWPIVFLVQFAFTLGISIFVSVIGVFFRDIQNVLTIAFRLGFYLSGAMYQISRIPEPVRPYFEWNPIHIFFDSYRRILLYDQFPSATRLGAICLASLLLILGGLSYMDRKEGTFIKHL